MDTPFVTAVGRAPSLPPSRDRRLSTALLAEITDGLARKQRELPTRFLNDRAVAPLRRAIAQHQAMRWREVETPLVSEWMQLQRGRRACRRIVQLLGGPSDSAMPLLERPADAQPLAGFLAIDAHPDLANDGMELALRRDPELRAFAITTDVTTPLPVRRATGTIFTLLAGSLGSFSPVVAIRVLRSIRAVMAPGDELLIGLDLRQASLRVAQQGVPEAWLTQWHRHALVVLTRDLGASVTPERFSFAMRASDDDRRLDEGLECNAATRILAPGLEATALRPGDFIRTAAHHTYDRVMLQSMLRGVGLSLDDWAERASGDHALATATILRHDDGQP